MDQQAKTNAQSPTYRKISVSQKGFYTLWGMVIFLLLFVGVLTILYFAGPPIDRIQGRRASLLIALIYALPLLWILVIGCLAWLVMVLNKNYPREIEIDQQNIKFHTRSGGIKHLDALAVTHIKRDRHGTLHFTTREKKNAGSIALQLLRKEDRDWVTVYVQKVCAFLGQEGRPVAVS